MSLAERVAMFKKRFPYAHCTVYKLRKLYRQYGIKKKQIRKIKVLPPAAAYGALEEAINLQADVRSSVL